MEIAALNILGLAPYFEQNVNWDDVSTLETQGMQVCYLGYVILAPYFPLIVISKWTLEDMN